MPTHRFDLFYDQTGDPVFINFGSPNSVVFMDGPAERAPAETVTGAYNRIHRWAHAPLFTVSLQIQLLDLPGYCRARDAYELIRRGHKFGFAYDASERETAAVTVDMGFDADHMTVDDALTVDKWYRLMGWQGYADVTAAEKLEDEWPGYNRSHMFKVAADLGGNEYIIDPPVDARFRAGASVTSHRYFAACTVVSQSFRESYHGGVVGWMWALEFMEQRPPTLTFPAW